MEFRDYIEATEQMTDVNKTLTVIPKSHAQLVKGYKYKFKSNNTLDGKHIGELDPENKKITVAAPWNYGRQYAVLHEIGHRVWEDLVDDAKKKEWQKIVNNTKNKQNQNAEELFCMAYADYYAKNKVVIHNHPEWEKFIKSLPK